MNDLKFFYENPPEFAGFIPRKRGISSAKTIIYGVLNSGKSAVLKNEISELKKDEILYLNLADLRLEDTVAGGTIAAAKNSAGNTNGSEVNENEISGEATLDARMPSVDEFYHADIKNIDTKGLKNVSGGSPHNAKNAELYGAKNRSENFFREIKEFLTANEQISSLFLDNFSSADFEISSLQSFAEGLNLKRFIISTRDRELVLPSFERLELLPLSFEEFIAFDKRHNEINSMISAFLAQGGGAKNPFIAPAEILEFEQRLLAANFSRTEILILKECLSFVHAAFSANKIYTALKPRIKISKDAVYGTIAKLERENFIRFLSKAGEPARAKKLYFSHFNMREILTSKKDFSKKFANVLFCELLGLNTPIFYTKELDFYLPALKVGVLVIPFSDADIIFLKFRKILSVLKRLGITSLKVVSMANSGRLEIEGIRCDVLPFHEFALSF
ncbi:ATP-binding protein [uncultured Campylobacter sp.]|uniref:ATP-binding protein n=1 Tax=uncultured Campylobacter sp. TaxID=218934 RepID=UPI002623C2F2|nr:ATP-binding protein [uncultured Campylobacter sp.]